MLPNVDQLLNEGHTQAACVLAWAALEAAMRHVASAAEWSMPRQTPMELLRTLYGNGFLTKKRVSRLNQSFRLRSEIVHGLIPPAIDVAWSNRWSRRRGNLLAATLKPRTSRREEGAQKGTMINLMSSFSCST